MRRLARVPSALLGAALCLPWLLCLGVATFRMAKVPLWKWTSRRWAYCRRPWLSWSPWTPYRRLGPNGPVVLAPVRRKLTRAERDAVITYLRRTYGDACYLCGGLIDFWCHQSSPWAEEVDHVVPLAAGGCDDLYSNGQLTHARCNRSKGARVLPGPLPQQPGRAA